MFHFFERKVFLADYLHGLVDIHNHILPGIDDGAKTVEDSINLIKAFSEFGVTSFICTPHIMHHYYPNTPSTIKKAFDILKTELTLQGLTDIKVHYAAEHMIDENFENILEAEAVLPLNNEYILIEMSYLQPSLSFGGAIQKIARKSLFPILAHPERYAYYHNTFGVYESFKSKGISFQLNILSLGGYYGPEIQKVALSLLKAGYIDFISSDAHHITHISQIKEIRIRKSTLNLLLPIIENTILNFY
ncbi:tyrosine-protein phosphatase [Flagellimonas allohymeniacidonis]|uniref:protein-tyrosine-phosphatase n=1 Tax=Flagellimonas allohymeniacidonis TaxID=2517819 RepID=A0A4Q8QDW2_9FLAO|nr:CpsB/CapC family capsule biosynthesis tyrosine phosphatase [Allomuricauda hymeniacidonis]TAI48591.1 histidinol phosphatase [Allomuricauda hymeniacidonis]